MNNFKILVTGADGFIGSHLVERLLLDGYQVKAFVLYNSFNHLGHLESIPQRLKDKLEIHVGDIRDQLNVERAVEGVDVILHLASLIAIPYSYEAPQSYIDTNVTGTLNVMMAARKYKVRKVIHTSTSETYGSALYVPIDEKHPLQPQSPYSASKISADQIALSFYYSFDLPVTVLRPFNTYGPRQSARAVIPTIITQIASGISTLKLGSLEPTRDFNYIEDTVNAFIQAMLADNVVGEVINVGSGHEISIGQLAYEIAQLMDKEISIETDQIRLRPQMSEVDRLLADAKKARKLIHWAPKIEGLAGLQAGLGKTIEWFCQSENLSKYKLEYNV